MRMRESECLVRLITVLNKERDNVCCWSAAVTYYSTTRSYSPVQ